METTDKNVVESVCEDSEDGFDYEENPVDEENMTEEDEELENIVKALSEPTKNRISLIGQTSSPTPETVDDFLRNFLVKKGMNKTMHCFQTEWYEMLQKGTLKTDLVDFVPENYTPNQLSESQLKNIEIERDSYKDAFLQCSETIVNLQKERDFHRLHHKRVLGEKNRLIEDIRRLKEHYASYESALKELNEKYDAAIRQKMLISIERDKACRQVHTPDGLHSSLPIQKNLKEKRQEKGSRPLEDEVTPYGTTKSRTSKHPKDSEFPPSTHVHPYLSQIRALWAQSSKTIGFNTSKSLKAHTMAVSCLALHPSKFIVSSSSDDHLWKLWLMPEEEMIISGKGHTDWLSSCSFHPNGNCLATTSGDTTVKIWDFEKSCCVLTLEGHTHATWGCSFHSYGDFVVSCSMDSTVKVWDLNSERCRNTLRGHVDSVNCINFLPFSNILLTCSADKTISVWDVRTGLCAQTFYGHKYSCNSANFNALGDTIASCDSHGVVKLWDVRSLSLMVTVDTGPHSSNQVAFSPNGQVVAVANNDCSVKLIEVASSQVFSLLGHRDAVQSIIFDHTGEYLLSAGSDGEILIRA